ncbi:unnamed protein product [Penicillium olsonii]|nr:unnamed protein product [Penicillium olsonii]CAG7929696.1 unnamed protein product [Penicillium olsonii]
MNKELFQPRGLFCLVMTWNSELADQPSTTLDLTSMVFKSSDAGSDMLSRLRHKFKSSDGKTYGNIFPEVAPLIFPGLDELASDQDAAKKISKTKKKMEFVNGYFDKRAQAQFPKTPKAIWHKAQSLLSAHAMQTPSTLLVVVICLPW